MTPDEIAAARHVAAEIIMYTELDFDLRKTVRAAEMLNRLCNEVERLQSILRDLKELGEPITFFYVGRRSHDPR